MTSSSPVSLNSLSDFDDDDDLEVDLSDDIDDNRDIVDDERNNEPFINMEFDSVEDGYQYFNLYGLKNGFTIRKRNKYVSRKSGDVTCARFVCSREGFDKRQIEKKTNDETSEIQKTPEKVFPHKRCGCMVFFNIKPSETGKWELSSFKIEHNHALVVSPSKKRFFPSQRFITLEQKELIRMLSDQNMGVDQIMAVIAEKEGGMDKVRCTKKDVINEIQGSNNNLRGVDVSSTLTYFLKVQKKDPEFFYEIEEDINNVVKNVFWIDGRSRRAYQIFSDVITFDTTYSTNKYKMPFAPFIGVNHQRQSMFFGCALLRDEGKVNFEWLFQTWLKAMNGKKPKAIITDQDPAMKCAIEKVFPDTVHRCCQWHVMRKAREHLSSLYRQINGFKNEMFDCIDKSLTVEEFIRSWEEIVTKYDLKEHRHLKLMFTTRNRWVPAYFRNTFFANMSTSQRSESMNALLKNWVNSHSSIYKFVVQFDKMVQSIYARESHEDYKEVTEEPALWSVDPIEKEARKVYTKNNFSLFKMKLKLCSEYRLIELEKDLLYEARNKISGLSYKVRVDIKTEKILCECKGFEFEGIICPHALKVMDYIGLNNIPSQYVLKRWTKNANKGVNISAGNSSSKSAETSGLSWYNILHAEMKEILKEGSKNCGAYEIAYAKVKELRTELVAYNTEISPEVNTSTLPSEPINKGYRDPPESQCKGKRKPQRHKPPYEIKAKKMRTCGICGKKEGHNATTCPMRKE